MEHSPSASDGQEFPRILWNPNVHYCVHHSHLPVRTLNQINSVHALSSHFFKIRFNSGERDSTVVKVLCYKSEGRWFDSS